jgi:hypothetical protein
MEGDRNQIRFALILSTPSPHLRNPTLQFTTMGNSTSQQSSKKFLLLDLPQDCITLIVAKLLPLDEALRTFAWVCKSIQNILLAEACLTMNCSVHSITRESLMKYVEDNSNDKHPSILKQKLAEIGDCSPGGPLDLRDSVMLRVHESLGFASADYSRKWEAFIKFLFSRRSPKLEMVAVDRMPKQLEILNLTLPKDSSRFFLICPESHASKTSYKIFAEHCLKFKSLYVSFSSSGFSTEN